MRYRPINPADRTSNVYSLQLARVKKHLARRATQPLNALPPQTALPKTANINFKAEVFEYSQTSVFLPGLHYRYAAELQASFEEVLKDGIHNGKDYFDLMLSGIERFTKKYFNDQYAFIHKVDSLRSGHFTFFFRLGEIYEPKSGFEPWMIDLAEEIMLLGLDRPEIFAFLSSKDSLLHLLHVATSINPPKRLLEILRDPRQKETVKSLLSIGRISTEMIRAFDNKDYAKLAELIKEINRRPESGEQPLNLPSISANTNSKILTSTIMLIKGRQAVPILLETAIALGIEELEGQEDKRTLKRSVNYIMRLFDALIIDGHAKELVSQYLDLYTRVTKNSGLGIMTSMEVDFLRTVLSTNPLALPAIVEEYAQVLPPVRRALAWLQRFLGLRTRDAALASLGPIIRQTAGLTGADVVLFDHLLDYYSRPGVYSAALKNQLEYFPLSSSLARTLISKILANEDQFGNFYFGLRDNLRSLKRFSSRKALFLGVKLYQLEELKTNGQLAESEQLYLQLLGVTKLAKPPAKIPRRH